MVCVKKWYRDELLQLALLLSLLRGDNEVYIGSELPVGGGGDLLIGHRSIYPLRHPKSLLNYERAVFDELNSLGRYHRYSPNEDVTAYLLDVAVPSTSWQGQEDPEVERSEADLSLEDMLPASTDVPFEV